MIPVQQKITRRATSWDIGPISALVMAHARRGDVLPRSLQSIRETIGDWVVIEQAGQVVACGSLLHYGPGLAEVRSLVVAEQVQGNGCGRAVVESLIEIAQQQNLHTLFALTRAVSFFQRLGFSITMKDRFPEKVWRDCNQCPIMAHCDETAVALELSSNTNQH